VANALHQKEMARVHQLWNETRNALRDAELAMRQQRGEAARAAAAAADELAQVRTALLAEVAAAREREGEAVDRAEELGCVLMRLLGV
jgi:hypothetical protein